MADSTRRPAVCRDLGDGRYGIWTHYDDRYEVKALAGARWDPALKCWTVPRVWHAEAERLVKRLNARGAATPGEGDATALSRAFVAMFTALPQPWRRPVYRALVKALHPDHGGDTATAQALNDAWGRGS